jgi:aerobic carbon-monoxide dehydrogenase medium subunit
MPTRTSRISTTATVTASRALDGSSVEGRSAPTIAPSRHGRHGPTYCPSRMKPATFEYHAPTTVEDAVGLLREHGDDAKVLAGGQSLVPMLSLRLASFGHLVDLGRIAELRGLQREDGALRIGAMTAQAAVEHDADAIGAVPLLGEALPLVGHFQIRNRGTIGGSIAHADPASELPAVALALDAEMDVAGVDGPRGIGAADFFQGTWTTALTDDEILTGVRFPVWAGSCGFAVEEVARRHGDFAIVGAVAAVEASSGAPTRAGIALFGVAPTPVRASGAESALVGGADPAEAGRLATEGLEPADDIHASSEYRQHLAAVVVERALRRAMRGAGL